MSSVGDKRIAALFDSLSTFSQSLLGQQETNAIVGALDAVLAATGCGRGAAYATTRGALALVAERGLPNVIRPMLERLPLGESPAFIVQQAAYAKGLVVDRFAAAIGSELAGTLVVAGWSSAVACPIVAEGRVHGVLVIAAPAEEIGAAALAALQVVCNLVALQLVRRGLEQRLQDYQSGDAQSVRLLVLGMLAGGVAGELEPALGGIEHGLAEERRRVDELRHRPWSDSEIDDISRLVAGSTAAVGQARKSAARLLVTVSPGAPGPPAVPEPVDMGAAATDALALVAPVLRSRNIEVRARCPEGHVVMGGKGEMIQLVVHVLLNLAGVLDAPHALVERKPANARIVEIDLYRQGTQVVLRMSDAWNIVDSARARLLASPVSSGEHGLGFAVAREIVIAHRGHIELGPDGAGGVRCDVVLPAAGAPSELSSTLGPRAAPNPGPAGPAHGAMGSPAGAVGSRARAHAHRRGAAPVILWIDDELSAQVVAPAFDDCEVHIAGTAAEATQLLFRLGTSPSVIFCSLRLPDRPGHELHADIAGFSPELAKRFVFLADGLLSRDVASYLVESGCPTLMRPLQLEVIRDLAFAEKDATARAAPTLTPPSRPDISPLPDDGRVAEPVVTRTATGRIVPSSSRPPPSSSVVAPPPSSTITPGDRPSTDRVAAAEPAAAQRGSRFQRVHFDGAAFGPDDQRTTPTDPAVPADGAASDGERKQTLRSSGTGLEPTNEPQAAQPSDTGEAEPEAAPAMREKQLQTLALAVAETLRRSGPMRGPQVLEMLRGRGLSETESLSVVMHALSTGTLLRDPPWSIMLKAAPVKPTKSVLVVEDDDDVRESVRQVLEEDGYTVETATNGQQALETLRRGPNSAQLVVLDLNMPVMDGWEFLREARNDPALARIPVVVVSGKSTTHAAEGFLPKPINYYALLATVERLSKRNAAAST